MRSKRKDESAEGSGAAKRAWEQMRLRAKSEGNGFRKGETDILANSETASNGENLISADGATRAEAWASALEQARSLGMLGT